MRYHLLINAPNGNLPVGPIEGEHMPAIDSIITETVGGEQMKLKVVGHFALPLIPGATVSHDEPWVACQPV